MNTDAAKLHVTIGAESSDDEYQAVSECFQASGYDQTVSRNYVRASAGGLPMVVMVVAWNVASNAVWDMIKFSFSKLLADKRLADRKPTIVVKRIGYDAILSEKGFHIRSVEEQLTFQNIDDLIKYTTARDKDKNSDSKKDHQ